LITDELIQIMRKYNPDIDEFHNKMEDLEYQCAIADRAKDRTALNFEERVAKKRLDELISIQFDDFEWKYNYPTIHRFIQQHPRLRFPFFEQIMTDEELNQVKQEVEIISSLPLFTE
jgi:hypothetical protein